MQVLRLIKYVFVKVEIQQSMRRKAGWLIIYTAVMSLWLIALSTISIIGIVNYYQGRASHASR